MRQEKRKSGLARTQGMLAVLAMLMFFAYSKPAAAQCETGIAATAALNSLINLIVSDTNKFMTQETNFLYDKIVYTASYEIQERFNEFDDNIRTGQSTWWRDHFEPAMKAMTQQLNVQLIDKQRQIGTLMDAKVVGEYVQSMQKHEAEAVQRYTPNEMSCQVDSVGQGQLKVEQMSKAIVSAQTKEDEARSENVVGTAAAQGRIADRKRMWDEYTTYFCDAANGGMGCPPGPPPAKAGLHADIPTILWGDKQTLDPTVLEDRVLLRAAMEYFVDAPVEDPVSIDVDTAPAQRVLLARRAHRARLNTIYNVVSQMLSDRVGGSGVNTQGMRILAGLDPANASTDASYHEIKTAMTKDRFQNPAYVGQMINNPEQLVREQGSINALRMQQMFDLYKRMEEVLFMEAAVFTSELDRRIKNKRPPKTIR